jgi:hypothetical protein
MVLSIVMTRTTLSELMPSQQLTTQNRYTHIYCSFLPPEFPSAPFAHYFHNNSTMATLGTFYETDYFYQIIGRFFGWPELPEFTTDGPEIQNEDYSDHYLYELWPTFALF